MPKLLVAASVAKPKDKKAATSMQNMKKLIEKRAEKDSADVEYTVVTINTKMKLANVVALINSTTKKLMEHEGVLAVETYKLDLTKQRGRWEIEAVKGEFSTKKEKSDGDEKPKKKKKKKMAKEEEG